MTPDTEAFCLALAPVVAAIVQVLKRIPFARRHPHIAALVVSTLAHVLARAGDLPHLVDTARLLALCVAQTWLASIGAYQVTRKAYRTAKRNIGPF